MDRKSTATSHLQRPFPGPAATCLLLALPLSCRTVPPTAGQDTGDLLAVNESVWICPVLGTPYLDPRILSGGEQENLSALESLLDAMEPVSGPCTTPPRSTTTNASGSGQALNLAPIVTPAEAVEGVQVLRRAGQFAWRLRTLFRNGKTVETALPESQRATTGLRRLIEAAKGGPGSRLAALGTRIKNAFPKLVADAGDEVKLPSGFKFNPATYAIDANTERDILDFFGKQHDILAKSANLQKIIESGEHRGLSTAESIAINYYTRQGFLDFASLLNGSGARYAYEGELLGDALIEKMFRAAASGLRKLDAYEGNVYFGAALPEKQYLNILKPGKIFRQRNFTSTTTDVKIARMYAGRNGQEISNEIDKGNASFFFFIKGSKDGKSISALTPYPFEEEVLFGANKPFKVQSITKSGENMWDVVLSD